MFGIALMELVVEEAEALGPDPEAFRGFYERALPRIYGYFLHRGGGPAALAEDLTQETFLAAVAELKKGRRVDTPIPWIYGIARHKLLDHYRKQERVERQPALEPDAKFGEIALDESGEPRSPTGSMRSSSSSSGVRRVAGVWFTSSDETRAWASVRRTGVRFARLGQRAGKSPAQGGLRRSFALSGVARQHWRSVKALGEAEWPRDERRDSGGIGVERIHQHDVRLRKDLRAQCRQQAPAFLEPVGHPLADRIVVGIVVGVRDPLRNRIDFSPAKGVVVWRIGRIARQVTQGDQHREPRLRGEVDDRHPGR